ncbi:MAG TPA: cohesin domain-containing protein, partial [Anaerolineales bacterium]|nr:cohesin domain-containing protein [Anaerolineales bacterium]
MMKFKHVLKVLVIAAVLLAAMGNFQGAQAQGEEPVVVVRDLTYWDATYTGYVDENRFEKWPVVFSQAEDFSVTATPTGEGLTTLIVLLDESGTELASASGMLTSSQPAGIYFVWIEPETGSGFYDLTIRRVDVEPTGPSSTTSVEPVSVLVGESAAVSVSLDNVPAEGYTSAEFTCSYDATLVEVSNIVVTDLFGADSATAINGPADGSFIVAVAGSNGSKATNSGVAFTFSALGLQAGQATIACVARVSAGDSVLTELPSTAATLTITDEVVVLDGTFEGQVLASKFVTIDILNLDGSIASTVTTNPDGTFSLTAPA